jgi:hypothetical protein
MMQDAAGFAHARGADDDDGFLEVVQFFGFRGLVASEFTW